jgi:hypothetical protein
MKIASAALMAVGLACTCWSMPVQAQGLPQGTYLNTCTGAHLEGDTLVARCRTPDGREQRSALAGVNRCVGDIGNSNGSLQCNLSGPAGPRAQGPGPQVADRCGGLHREAEDLRGRLDHEFNPIERAHIEGRLREIHEQEEHCG